MAIRIQIKCTDAVKFTADVLALKYARRLYGVDDYVVELLRDAGVPESALRPDVGAYSFTDSRGAIEPSSVLLLGVKRLAEFGYQEIRDFSRSVLTILREAAPETEHLCLTLHGANYGLDEVEAFQSEIAGILEAVQEGDCPARLRRISIAEINKPRAERLDAVLDDLLPSRSIPTAIDAGDVPLATREQLRSVGYASEGRPHIFVAMPFAEEMNDTYHYGIQGAVRNAGFICERADYAIFSGDILDWVKRRIGTASLLVADLTTANPNVYLEVGYAWGRDVTTVLLAKCSEELKFDVRGQRCLIYKNIKDLEEKLTAELRELSPHKGGGA